MMISLASCGMELRAPTRWEVRGQASRLHRHQGSFSCIHSAPKTKVFPWNTSRALRAPWGLASSSWDPGDRSPGWNFRASTESAAQWVRGAVAHQRSSAELNSLGNRAEANEGHWSAADIGPPSAPSAPSSHRAPFASFAPAGDDSFTPPKGGKMYKVQHNESGYPGLVYVPPKVTSENSLATTAEGKLPLLVVLHGAGKNQEGVWNLANPRGEHAGLAPSLLASGQAPSVLAENFLVVAPYSYKKQSFYDDSRSDLLRFIKWLQESGDSGISHLVDPERVFLFGFSDGATVGVELMFTRRFRGGVFAAYGFTGHFPARALELLKDLNMWVFHSKDDVIFPVRCSDNLVASLRKVNTDPERVRYTRYEMDQEGFTGSVRGHSTGITASKLPAIYEWMLGL